MKKPEFIRKHFPDSALLGEAREWARAHALRGCICPLCKGKVKQYDRKIGIAAGRVMVTLYRNGEGREYVHVPTLVKTEPYLRGTAQQGGYGLLGQHWGLIEAQDGERDDGSKRTGWWRLTDEGRGFVRGEIEVPKKVRLYNGDFQRYVDMAPWSIEDALGERFDYRDLMGDE